MSIVIDHSTEPVWTRGRLIGLAASLIVISALAFVSFRVGERASHPVGTISPPVAITASAPAAPAPAPLTSLPAQISSASLKSAKGSSFKLADFSGKVMLVNLWATWCGPCRLETPELIKLHKEFQSRGVEMIGLSTEDPGTSAEAVRKFVQDFKVDYLIGWAPGEVVVPLQQGRNSIPQSFIIARDGRILNHFVGFSPANTSSQLREALEAALKQ